MQDLAKEITSGYRGQRGVMTQGKDVPEAVSEPVTDQDHFWLEIAQGMAKESVSSLEEAAKQLITVASLLQGIYFAAISFSDLKKVLVVQDIKGWLLVILFTGPIIPWLLSVGLAIQVFKPESYETNLRSPKLSHEVYKKVVEYKQRYLHYAHWALLAGSMLLVINIIVYLGFMPSPPK